MRFICNREFWKDIFKEVLVQFFSSVFSLTVIFSIWSYFFNPDLTISKIEYLEPSIHKITVGSPAITEKELKDNLEKNKVGQGITELPIFSNKYVEFELQIKGRGEISEAYLFYDYIINDGQELDERHIKTSLIDKNQKISKPIEGVVHYQTDSESSVKRVYLLLKDAKDGSSSKYLLLLNDGKLENSKVYSELDIMRTIPYKDAEYISQNIITILEELSLVK